MCIRDRECADKDTEIAELKAETNAKDSEIEELKLTCNEREQLIIRLDGGLKDHIRAAAAREARMGEIEAAKARLEETLGRLPPDASTWAQALHDKDVHIVNIEAILRIRDEEILALRQTSSNYASGYGNIEMAKHYGRLLTEKEAVIQELHRACVEREAVINQLAAEATAPTAKLRRLWIALSLNVREKLWRPVDRWVFRRVVENYWMQIGILRQYEPRPIEWDPRMPKAAVADDALPRLGIVTPSFAQPAFLESTMLSILNQDYPRLLYVVQDGASRDASAEIIARYGARLTHWASEPDNGQADAVRKGFARIEAELGPDDVMAWFNSDDLVAPLSLIHISGRHRRQRSNPDKREICAQMGRRKEVRAAVEPDERQAEVRAVRLVGARKGEVISKLEGAVEAEVVVEQHAGSHQADGNDRRARQRKPGTPDDEEDRDREARGAEEIGWPRGDRQAVAQAREGKPEPFPLLVDRLVQEEQRNHEERVRRGNGDLVDLLAPEEDRDHRRQSHRGYPAQLPGDADRREIAPADPRQQEGAGQERRGAEQEDRLSLIHI